jgi:hypothetical protein
LGIFPNGGGGAKTKSAFFPTCGWEKRGGINFDDQIPNLLYKTLFRPGFENPYSGQVGVENTPAFINIFSAP